MLKPGTILGGRYEIIKSIGTGGMAIVYLAKDYKLHREVAVKVLKPELSADEVVLSKFRKEGLAAASLSHSNIVGVYDLGRDVHGDYIVMEYIDGITLKDYIRRRQKLTNDEIFKISMKIADALKAAHANNIIHRDIKPQNIMVAPNGAVKVTDFGIAKATTTSTMTGQGEAMGSVHYFSPEQARGRNVDKRSDLYSMGITMFEMATNQLPFEGDTPVATAMKQIHDPLPDVERLNPELWPGLVSIIKKLTNKQPEERYQDAGQVLEDLKRVYQNPNYTVDSAAKYKSYVAPKPNDPRYQGMDALQDENKKEKGKKKLWIWIAVGIVVLAALAVFAKVFFFDDKAGQVPKLVGYTQEEAEERAEDRGYIMSIESQEYNEEYEAGAVISQKPDAGTDAKEGTTITVVLSMGKYEANIVPECAGLTYAEAVDKLISLGIPYQVETAASEEIPMGSVISQEPVGGEELKADTILTITISSGGAGEGIRVPDLAGMSRDEAADALEELNLVLGEVSLSYHDSIPSGQVIAQDLKDGSQVQEGTAVNVTISQGVPGEDEQEEKANGTIIITNPLSEDQESGQLTVEAINAEGNSTGLYNQNVTKSTFGADGIEVSYPSGTVKIRVYLDNKEVFVRDIN